MKELPCYREPKVPPGAESGLEGDLDRKPIDEQQHSMPLSTISCFYDPR
jgi:hypothetical protein